MMIIEDWDAEDGGSGDGVGPPPEMVLSDTAVRKCPGVHISIG